MVLVKYEVLHMQLEMRCKQHNDSFLSTYGASIWMVHSALIKLHDISRDILFGRQLDGFEDGYVCGNSKREGPWPEIDGYSSQEPVPRPHVTEDFGRIDRRSIFHDPTFRFASETVLVCDRGYSHKIAKN